MKASARTCLFFLDRLWSEIDRLKADSYPDHHTGPKKWLQFTLGAVETAQSYLVKADTPGLSIGEYNDLIAKAESLGDIAYDWLNFVAGTDVKSIPFQVVAPFRRWVESLHINNTIFFRAEHLSNYELLTIDYSDYADNLLDSSTSFRDASRNISWPVQLVTVPSQSMAMLPHFAVVAHELGHSIQEMITPDFTAYSSDETEFFERVRVRLNKLELNFDNTEVLRCQNIAKQWINEFIADAVGHVLVGPAFFFALSSFLELTGAGYGVAPTHPPSDLRLGHLLNRLQHGDESFSDVFKKETDIDLSGDITNPNLRQCPPTDQMFSILCKNHTIVDAAICSELIPFFSVSAECIFMAAEEYVARIAPDLIYTPGEFKRDIDRHLDMLIHLVPPIEYTDNDVVLASSLSSVLNIGWIALLAKLEDMPNVSSSSLRSPDALKMDRLHELLLKAVELSEARRLWEEYAR